MKKILLAMTSLLFIVTLAGCGHKYLGKKDVTYVYKITAKSHGKSTVLTTSNGKLNKNGSTALTFHKDGTYDQIYMSTHEYKDPDSIQTDGSFQHGSYTVSGKTAKLKPSFSVSVSYNSDYNKTPSITRNGAKTYPMYFDSKDNLIFKNSKPTKSDKELHTSYVNNPITPVTSHKITKSDMTNACKKYLEFIKSAYEVYGK
jgi:outer membrane lipopolysaccharide assembly protein LptE/RlpB